MKAKTIALWGCAAASGLGIIAIGAMVVGSGLAWVGLRGGGSYEPPFVPHRVIDADHALFIRQGFEGASPTPFAARSMTLASGSPERTWEWSHAGQGLDQFSSAGPWIAAKLVANDRGIEAPVFAFHRDRGLVWEATRASEVHLLDRSELLFRAGKALSLVRLDAARPAVAWSAAVPTGAYLGFYGWTETHVVLYNDGVGLHAYDRAKGGSPTVVDGAQALAGLSRERGEAIVLRDGRLVVVGLDGVDRSTLDLESGKPLTDSMEDPCLFGRHGDDWILVYTTGLDHTTSSNGRSWVRPADRTLVAVGANNGEVRWRLPVGGWALECYGSNEVNVDTDLGGGLFIMGRRDRETDIELDGMAGYVDLEKGTLVWQQTFEKIARAPLLLDRENDAAWLYLVDGNRPVLARFERGKLTGAARLASFTFIHHDLVDADTAWLSVRDGEESGWLRLSGPELAKTAGDTEGGHEDARAWVTKHMQLPEAAR